jgi:phosphoribosylformimino-5-aminoimidazole carboxamide ribotide isomerase
LEKLVEAVGKERLVLDLSCKKVGEEYLVVTDRWQKITEEVVCEELLDKLSAYCDEFLVHAVDVEGKAQGIECELVSLLGAWQGLPITYAGGVHSYEDLDLLKELGQNRLNVTIGSALDLFGGQMEWNRVMEKIAER